MQLIKKLRHTRPGQSHVCGHAILEEGSEVDLMRGGQLVRWDKPDPVAAPYGDLGAEDRYQAVANAKRESD